mmetsp:Transcript_3593/g.6557  ORF Transcript_3593/g.6557 Transcript_3593/m.6557 type:complete len:378 (-) Transcript_3593:582-1715(-)
MVRRLPTGGVSTTATKKNNNELRPAVPAHAWWLVMEMKKDTLSEYAKNNLYYQIAGSGGLDGLEYKSDRNDVVPLVFHYQGGTHGVIITAAHRNELIALMDGIKQTFRVFMIAAIKQLACDKAVTHKFITSEQSFADLRKTLANMELEFFTANKTAIFSLQQVSREFIKTQCSIFFQEHVGGIRVEITDPSAGWKHNPERGGYELVSLTLPQPNWSGHSLWIMVSEMSKEVARSLQKASQNGKSKCKVLARPEKRKNDALLLTTNDELDNNNIMANEPKTKRSKRNSSGSVIIMRRQKEENDNHDITILPPPSPPDNHDITTLTLPPPKTPPPPPPPLPPKQYSITSALMELKNWTWHSEIDKEKVFSLLGIMDDAV